MSNLTITNTGVVPMAADTSRIKKAVSRVRGGSKAIKLAFRTGAKAAEAKAGKGNILAMVAGGAAGTGGTALATAGKLSIVVGGYRLPIIGTAVAILTGFAAYFTRKRPALWKPLAAISVAAGTSQILDIVKHGVKVKGAEEKK